MRTDIDTLKALISELLPGEPAELKELSFVAAPTLWLISEACPERGDERLAIPIPEPVSETIVLACALFKERWKHRLDGIL